MSHENVLAHLGDTTRLDGSKSGEVSIVELADGRRRIRLTLLTAKGTPRFIDVPAPMARDVARLLIAAEQHDREISRARRSSGGADTDAEPRLTSPGRGLPG